MKVRTEALIVEAGGELQAREAATFFPPQFTGASLPGAAPELAGMLAYNLTTQTLWLCTGATWVEIAISE